MKKMTAIFLMLTVLIASIGVSVNTHICKKEGVIKSYFVDFGECVCEVEIEEAPAHKCCHKQTVEKTEQKGCCQEETAFFQLNFDYVTQIENVSLNPDLLFTSALIYTIFTPLNIEENTNIVEFNHYLPPIPNRDIPILIQSFLI